MSTAIDRGFVSVEAAHTYTTLPEATRAWLDRHYLNLPDDARPERNDLAAFSNLFSTYLESSFDLVDDPGQRLYSPRAHCFCPLCSWLVNIPHLQTKKIQSADKKRAHRLKVGYLHGLGIECGRTLTDEQVEQLLADSSLRETIALCTYAKDLLERLKGHSEGPATLVLWRAFAWRPQGSPKKNFALTADAIMDAESTTRERVLSNSLG